VDDVFSPEILFSWATEELTALDTLARGEMQSVPFSLRRAEADLVPKRAYKRQCVNEATTMPSRLPSHEAAN